MPGRGFGFFWRPCRPEVEPRKAERDLRKER